MKKIKFSDGYVVGLKIAVNLKTGKLTGLKSHDFHILMERLSLSCFVVICPTLRSCG
jgi:hypothetical protein